MLDDWLAGQSRRSRPRSQQRLGGSEVEVELALVVGDAAAEDAVAHDDRFERGDVQRSSGSTGWTS